MKTISSVTLLTSFFAAATLLTIFALTVNAQQTGRATKSTPLTWEYKIVAWSQISWAPDKSPDQLMDRKEILEIQLNKEFGDKGWELCGIDTGIYYFRRPK